jgi:outer membrane immunogenic protein
MHKLNSSFVYALAVAGAACFAGVSANAADIYRPAEGGYKDEPVSAPVWSGFYLGANGGYGSSNSSTVSYSGSPASSSSFEPDGGFGGGQIGYIWQRGHFAFGAEADFEGAGITGSSTAGLASGSSSLDWFSTIRMRGGVTLFDRGLLYATGGLALGDFEDKISKTGAGSIIDNKSTTGYVVGGGFEYLVSPKWSVKAEYQFIDLGAYGDTVATNTPAYGHIDSDHKYNTVRVGINYHVAPGYEPLK